MIAAAVPSRSSIQLLESAAQAFPRMLRAIRAAHERVHLEIYALSPRGIGAEFVSALSDAARRGVRVRVVVDGWGTGFPARHIAAELRKAGCDVEIYNPLHSILRGRFRRDHRKLLLVDDRLAFLGGLNFLNRFLGDHGWADLAVEIQGPACADLGHRLRHEPHEPQRNGVRIWLSGDGGGRRLRKRYMKAFGAARSRIVLAQCYFLPDRALLRSLTAAARRGVRVTLLVPGRIDVPFVRAAIALQYERLLRAGIEVHEWSDSVLHAKLAVIDGEHLLLGSFNLDPFSLANLEALVEARDAPAAGAAERWILGKLPRARRIESNPLSRGIRLLGTVARSLADLIRKLLAW
jgi:cardiolipin synthase